MAMLAVFLAMLPFHSKNDEQTAEVIKEKIPNEDAGDCSDDEQKYGGAKIVPDEGF